VTISSPFLWKIEIANYVHLLVANYFNNLHGSLFPVFPGLNFLLAGAIFAKYFVDAGERNEEEKFINLSLYTGVVLLLLGHLFFSGLFPKTFTSISPNPAFYLERLGYVIVLLAICWHADKNLNIKNSIVLDASRESLLVYWMHLIIIFGTFWGGKSFAMIIGKTYNALETSIATIILITLMIITAKSRGWTKKKYPKQSSIFVKVAVAVLVIVFFIS
jgi:hypothetical protein